MSSQQNEHKTMRAGEGSVEATDIPTAPTAGGAAIWFLPGGVEGWVHSPLPWRVIDHAHIVDARGYNVLATKANAEYKVTACNAYPELIALLRDVRPLVAASAEASHFTDGFDIGADGLPCKRDVPATEADLLLQTVDAALAKLEAL